MFFRTIAFSFVLLNSVEAAQGVPWKLVDRFIPPGTESTFAGDLAETRSGFLIATGFAKEKASRLVSRRSLDGGRTWNIVDEFFYGAGFETRGQSIATDHFGNVHVVVQATSPNGGVKWVIRSSFDEGKTWKVVDEFGFLNFSFNFPYRVSTDSRGNVFVAGTSCNRPETSQSQVCYGVIRFSSDGGITWETLLTQKGAWFYGTTIDRWGRVYAVGATHRPVGKSAYEAELLLMRSYPGARGWEFARKWSFPGKNGGALNVLLDPTGGLYIMGSGWRTPDPKDQRRRSLVLKSTDLGNTWRVVDEFYLSDRHWSETYKMVASPKGYFTVGYAVDHRGIHHWIVRQSLDGDHWETAVDFAGDHGTRGNNLIWTSRGLIFASGAGYTAVSGRRVWELMAIQPEKRPSRSARFAFE